MAKKPTTPEPAAAAAPAAVQVPSRKARQAVTIQPELVTEIEKCKRRISSLKALNKLTPVIDGMDNDALAALKKIVDGRTATLSNVAT